MKHLPLILVGLGGVTLVNAGTMGPIQPSWSPIITATVGPDFLSHGRAQRLSLLPPFTNYYTVSDRTSTVVDGGLFLGVEHQLSSFLSGQLGVAGYWTSSSEVKGHVWQFSLPAFDNLAYRYKIQHQRYMASGKLLAMNWQAWHPYATLELGGAINRATDYRERPLIPQVVPMAPFRSHTETSFSYGVGVGADYDLTPSFRLGAGYQFSDLGKVSLGRSPAQVTSQTLQFNNRYANQLRFQLTYIV